MLYMLRYCEQFDADLRNNWQKLTENKTILKKSQSFTNHAFYLGLKKNCVETQAHPPPSKLSVSEIKDVTTSLISITQLYIYPK